MKIAHLTYSDSSGGAAIGAFRLHQAMLRFGADSHMFVLNPGSVDARIHGLLPVLEREENRAAQKLARILKQAYGAEELPIRSFNLLGVDTSSVLNAFEPDIVQMHWIANNTIRLDDLQNVAAPLVWKMPDMWPFCGGEHYINADQPQRHRLGYDAPHSGGEGQVDVDRFIWEYKRRCYAGLSLTITSPSRFLAREAHASKLLGAFDCHVIPNPFPEEFLQAPRLGDSERRELRRTLGLPVDRMVVMFAAYHTRERRKGFHHIETMLERHLPKRLTPAEVFFLVVGGDEPATQTLFDYSVRIEPTTADVVRYRSYLQASDLLLFPSEMDSTAMVIGEALACGVPAVCFAVGGLVDMVHHGKSGYLAPPYSAEALAEGLLWWRGHPAKEEISDYCRALVHSMHDPRRCVERYLRLYEAVLARTRTGRSFRTATLHDRDAEQLEQDPPRQLLIVDPSVQHVTDSSHNTELALAAHAVASLHGAVPRIVGNAACSLPGIAVEGRFDYTAYDKVRARSSGEKAATYEDVGHLVRAERAYAVLDELVSGKLGARDAVFLPMADRPCIDALLLYLARHDSAMLPSFHLNLMFENADFLVGEYPLPQLLRALAHTGYVGSRIFLYAETEPMARTFAALEDVPVEVLPPLPVLNPQKLRVLEGSTPALERAFEPAYAALHGAAARGLPERAPGEFWVVVPGRGRRDKGWARLPGIVAATRERAPGLGIRFLVQRPRKMDQLDEAVVELAKHREVTLLDEIIDNAALEAVLEAADLVLLPYERGVYAKRGSAFAWKAVANLTPLVVTRGTALREAIRWRNGLAAASDEEFAEAIVAIRTSSTDGFRAPAECALRALVEAAVTQSPLLRNAAAARAVKRETLLVIGTPPPRFLSPPADPASAPSVVRLVHAASAHAPDLHPHAEDRSYVVLAHETGSDGALLPTLVREAVGAGRFKEIVVTKDAPAGIREQLLASGAAAALIRIPAQSSLAPSDAGEQRRARRVRQAAREALAEAPPAGSADATPKPATPPTAPVPATSAALAPSRANGKWRIGIAVARLMELMLPARRRGAEERKRRRELLASGLFDADYYVRENPDVAAAGIDPALHYLRHGWAEGRQPGPEFDAQFYLDTHPDVREARVNPLLHYLRYGKTEGRATRTGPGRRQ